MALFGATVHISALIFRPLHCTEWQNRRRMLLLRKITGKVTANYQLIKKVTWILK